MLREFNFLVIINDSKKTLLHTLTTNTFYSLNKLLLIAKTIIKYYF